MKFHFDDARIAIRERPVMYEKFYGFEIKPFNLVPNPEVLYLSSKHQNALMYLEYGLMESVGFILLTGEIGTGKTTLTRYILNKVESDMEVAVVFNTNVSADELLYLILEEFEIHARDLNKAQALDKLNEFLIKKYAEDKKVLLIIDEAQNLSLEALEEIRMISNLQTDDNLLIQIMLVGQPELKTRLKSEQLTQLSQRIALNFHLAPLTREETELYIQFRIERAGGDPEIFTKDAIDLIFDTSRGTPRAINLLCDSALVYGYADEIRTINADVIEEVIKDRGDLSFQTAQDDNQSEAAGESTDESKRIATLEKEVKNLQKLYKSLQKDILEHSEKFKNRQLNKLYNLYLNEKKRTNNLLIGYTKLYEKYEMLVNDQQKDSKQLELEDEYHDQNENNKIELVFPTENN